LNYVQILQVFFKNPKKEMNFHSIKLIKKENYTSSKMKINFPKPLIFLTDREEIFISNNKKLSFR